MRKFIIPILAGLLIMASGTVYAQKLEFKASGFIDAVTEWFRNATWGSISSSEEVALDRTHGYLESRARLKFEAIMEKDLSGTIFFEMDSARWGETGDGRNTMGRWNADRAAVEIKNVFIDFGLPYFGIPAPVSMRVGLQPLSIRPGLLVYTDGMGVTAAIKADPVTIAPLWFKALENFDYTADDVDVYGLHGFGKVDTFTLGGYWLFYNMNSYPLPTAAAIEPIARSDMHWLGVYADGKVGPVNVNFDFIFDRGKVKPRDPLLEDIKFRGWVANLKVDYPWEKFNFGVVGMYASGSDLDDVDKVKSYVVPPGSESGAIYGESLVFYSSWVNRGNTGIANTISGTALSRGPVGGTWMGKLYGKYAVTPTYKVTLAALYIADTTKDGNTFGTARKADGTLRDDKTIGWEFDLYNEFQIYKNLKYTIAGGVMTVGDALKMWNGTGNEKPKSPWIIMSNLTYNF